MQKSKVHYCILEVFTVSLIINFEKDRNHIEENFNLFNKILSKIFISNEIDKMSVLSYLLLLWT